MLPPEIDAILDAAFPGNGAPSRSTPRQLWRDDRGTLWILSRRGRARLLLLESAVGHPLPSHADRLALRSTFATGRDPVLIADASHSHFVLTRFAPTDAGWPVYEEYRLPRDAPAFARISSRPRSGRPATAERQVGRGQLASLGETALARLNDVPGVRGLAATLRRVAILDRRARTGEWLIGAAEALEWLHRTAAGRMRGMLVDIDIARTARRPEYLRDFRLALEMIDRSIPGHPARCPIRQLILQRHLFGLARDEAHAERIRRRLLDWAGIPIEDAIEIDTCILGRAAGQPAGSAGVRPALPSADATDVAGIEHATSTLAAAWKLVADDRLRPDTATRAEWERAATQLSERWQAIRDCQPGAAARGAIPFPISCFHARPTLIEREE